MTTNSPDISGNQSELDKLIKIATDRLTFGAEEKDVVQQMVEFGMSEPEAQGLVRKIAGRVAADTDAKPKTAVNRARQTQVSDDSDGQAPVGKVLLGSLGAAVIGGLIWGLIADVTGYELGLVAWGIGGLVGFAAAMFAGNQIDGRVPVIAVGASLFGILLGKYLSFLSGYNEMMAAIMGPEGGLEELLGDDPEYTAEIAAEIAAEFGEMTQLTFGSGFGTFVGEYGMMIGLFDLLWIFLAVSTAWSVAGKRLG